MPAQHQARESLRVIPHGKVPGEAITFKRNYSVIPNGNGGDRVQRRQVYLRDALRDLLRYQPTCVEDISSDQRIPSGRFLPQNLVQIAPYRDLLYGDRSFPLLIIIYFRYGVDSWTTFLCWADGQGLTTRSCSLRMIIVMGSAGAKAPKWGMRQGGEGA